MMFMEINKRLNDSKRLRLQFNLHRNCMVLCVARINKYHFKCNRKMEANKQHAPVRVEKVLFSVGAKVNRPRFCIRGKNRRTYDS